MKIGEMYDALVDALVNSNLEMAASVQSCTSSVARAMMRLRIEENARIIAKARGE